MTSSSSSIAVGVSVAAAVVGAVIYVLWGPDKLLRRRGLFFSSHFGKSVLFVCREVPWSAEPWEHVLCECNTAGSGISKACGGVATVSWWRKTDSSLTPYSNTYVISHAMWAGFQTACVLQACTRKKME